MLAGWRAPPQAWMIACGEAAPASKSSSSQPVRIVSIFRWHLEKNATQMPATSWRLTSWHLAEAAHHLAQARLQRRRRARVALADHEGLVAADVHHVVLEQLRHLTKELCERLEGNVSRGVVVQLVTVLVMRFALCAGVLAKLHSVRAKGCVGGDVQRQQTPRVRWKILSRPTSSASDSTGS